MSKRLTGMVLSAVGMLAGVMLTEGVLTRPAFAEVNINVNIGPPPPVIVTSRPTMVYLPEPAMYVAVGEKKGLRPEQLGGTQDLQKRKCGKLP